MKKTERERKRVRKSCDRLKVRGKWKVKYTKLISVAHLAVLRLVREGEGEREWKEARMRQAYKLLQFRRVH